MPQSGKRNIWFESADGRSKIAGYFYEDPAVKPFCVLQISHGMCEFIERYEDFAQFLTAQGVAVCGNDHIGHGASVAESEDFGYFSEKDGRRFALADLTTMNKKAHEAYPGLPLVLLGHSMGSFFARKYAAEYPETIDGLIISGTAGPNPLAGMGIALTSFLSRVKGPRYRSRFVAGLATGSYLKRIELPNTAYDWISSDVDIVSAYAADPRCTFLFTVNGYHELFCALRDVSSPAWAVAIPKEMPVLMIQGAADPVGDYGKGTEKVRHWLHGAGVKNLTYKTYPGMRHEVLNEVGRQQVYDDVLAFLQQWRKQPQA